MSENDRQQRLIERVQEDERLRGDLTDDAATALVEWASRRVETAAADPARPDADVEADVQAIRTAARAAARAGEADPQRVVALADATLARQAAAAGSAPPPPTMEQAQPAPTPVEAANATPPPPTIEQTQPAPAQREAANATPPSPTTEQAQPAPAQMEAAAPPQRRLSLWRRWSPFANIWNRFRGDR